MELSTPARIGAALSESRIVRYARPYCWFSDSPLALSGGRRDHARAMLYAPKSSPLFPPNGRFQENRKPSRFGRVRWTALSVCGVGMVRCGYPRQAWRGQPRSSVPIVCPPPPANGASIARESPIPLPTSRRKPRRHVARYALPRLRRIGAHRLGIDRHQIEHPRHWGPCACFRSTGRPSVRRSTPSAKSAKHPGADRPFGS